MLSALEWKRASLERHIENSTWQPNVDIAPLHLYIGDVRYACCHIGPGQHQKRCTRQYVKRADPLVGASGEGSEFTWTYVDIQTGEYQTDRHQHENTEAMFYSGYTTRHRGEWGLLETRWREKVVDGEGALLIMVLRIPESERSAWRPMAADSSCISQPYEAGGGGDERWKASMSMSDWERLREDQSKAGGAERGSPPHLVLCVFPSKQALNKQWCNFNGIDFNGVDYVTMQTASNWGLHFRVDYVTMQTAESSQDILTKT
ncbi:hypothetical protein EYF80_033884 [Liparis tanakae]|uniref:Uncharacterized protein n=1 Tax=Liparis tanakae TaxID=230148 RepID=A0A4Z2GRY7_9TELE|nr:hypothetical protein EYF80_033884 [Liparis tanakae]